MEKELLSRLYEDKPLQQRFFFGFERSLTSNSFPKWRTKEVKAYLSLHKEFLKRLALIMSILGGQPPRATKLFSLQVENTMIRGLKHIFIEERLISFIITYYKGFNIDNKLKIVHRFLPKKVSLILVHYLAQIRPFIKQIHHFVYYQTAPISPQLWGGAIKGVWTSNKLSKMWLKESLKELGPQTRLTIALWRHIAIAISREHLPKKYVFDKNHPISH